MEETEGKVTLGGETQYEFPHDSNVAGAAAGGEEADEGQILEIYRVPLLGRHHDKGTVTVQDTAPDIVFERPRKPTVSLLETPDRSSGGTTTAASISGIQMQVAAAAAARHPSLPSVVLISALVTVAGVPAAMWFRRRARTRRCAFALAILRLENGMQVSSADPALSPGVREGSLCDREHKAAKQLEVLEELIAESLELNTRYPWEARQESRLRVCSRALSQRLVGMERAAEELRVMVEVERLLGMLESGGTGGGGDSDGEYFVNDCHELEERKKSGDKCGGGGKGDGGGAVRRRWPWLPQSARLSTRANALLSKRSIDGNGSGGTSRTRCVFRAELKKWCDALVAKEQEAADRLTLGLQRWDLETVDRALAQLRLLELPDLVEEFQDKRKDVEKKLRMLRAELKKAAGDPAAECYISRLREACVKAEAFSATESEEYKSAKLALGNARAAELERKARRIKFDHGIIADPNCNARLDSTSGPRLLLNDLPYEELSRGSGLVIGAGACTAAVSRRLALGTGVEGEKTCGAGGVVGAGGGLSSGGGCNGGRLVAGSGLTCQPAAIDRGIEASGGTAVMAWDRALGGGGEFGSAGDLQMLLVVRRSAESQFVEYAMQKEEEHRRACDADRRTVEKREERKAYQQEYIARLDARCDQEDERLVVEKERLRVDEDYRRQEREEGERQKDDKRLEALWSADGDFFSLLALTDVLVAAGTMAWRKGFSLSPRVLLNAAWGLVVAECREGVDSGEVDYAYPSPSSSSSSPGMDSSAVSGLACPSPATLLAAAANGGGLAGVAASSGGPGSDGGDENQRGLLWVWSTAGWAAGAVVDMGYSSVGWLLGQTLGVLSPGLQCEMRAVFSLVAWLFSLILVLKIVGFVGGDVGGPAGATVRLTILAAWVWSGFHDWLLEASWELLLFVAPAPLLALAYGYVLRYLERHLKPGGFWWVRGWDVRPVVSRALPAGVSFVLAWFLGMRSP